MNWFATLRQDWIKETLYVFGFINREHLCRKFAISMPQASKDINQFLRDYPDMIFYDMQAKKYVRKD